MSEINVRIRHADEAKAVPLCTWDMRDLEALMRLIRSWGLHVVETGTLEADDLAGQFVIAESEAFFEVIVGLGGES